MIDDPNEVRKLMNAHMKSLLQKASLDEKEMLIHMVSFMLSGQILQGEHDELMHCIVMGKRFTFEGREYFAKHMEPIKPKHK